MSGICLGIVGRFSQALAKKNLLPHESFMSFYSSLLTCCCAIIPMLPKDDSKEENNKVISNEVIVLSLTILSILVILKSMIWERGTM